MDAATAQDKLATMTTRYLDLYVCAVCAVPVLCLLMYVCSVFVAVFVAVCCSSCCSMGGDVWLVAGGWLELGV